MRFQSNDKGFFHLSNAGELKIDFGTNAVKRRFCEVVAGTLNR